VNKLPYPIWVSKFLAEPHLFFEGSSLTMTMRTPLKADFRFNVFKIPLLRSNEVIDAKLIGMKLEICRSWD